jgi:hypothetical protein
VRLLSDREQVDLPREKRESVSGKAGLWIEVGCPEGACSLDKNKITLPAGGVVSKVTKGLWLVPIRKRHLAAQAGVFAPLQSWT